MNSPTILNARGQVVAQTTSTLLSRVLAIASLGFVVTAVGVYFAPPVFSRPMFWVCIIASFALIFGVRATRANAVLSMGLFLLLTFVLGFEISPSMRMLLGTGHSNVIFNAAMTTGVGMGMLGIGAQFANFNYRRVAGMASAALLGLVAIGILSIFFHFIQPGVYSILTLIIFSVLVVTDFMRIRSGGDGQTAVELALSIYLDGLNIFLALTRLFRGGGRD